MIKTYCNHIIWMTDTKDQTKGNLYLGGIGALKQQVVADLKITAVLTIMDERFYKQKLVRERLDHMQIFDHKWIVLEDEETESISPFLHESHSFIKQKLKNHNLLVNCHMGVSRSSSLVIAFLMKQFDMGYQEAKKFTKSKRYIICPNEGFQQQLKMFEKEIQKDKLCKKQKEDEEKEVK